MFRPVLAWFSASALVILGARTRAAEPMLPPPRPVETIVVPVLPPPPTGYYRQSAYDVWQFYAVGQRGQWKPRVIMTPDANGYYMINGHPYPYVTVKPENLQRNIVGP